MLRLDKIISLLKTINNMRLPYKADAFFCNVNIAFVD